MICIFSNTGDHSTTEVMRWLLHLGHKAILRINSDEYADAIRIRMTGKEWTFDLQGQQVPLSALKAVWYRKGGSWLSNLFYKAGIKDNPQLNGYLDYKLKEEQKTLAGYIHYCLEQCSYRLGDASKLDLNKLLVLDMAQKAGLDVPPFLISNDKEEMIAFAREQGVVITKAMADGLYFFEQEATDTAYLTYTEIMDEAMWKGMPDRVAPCFLQRSISKRYELRIFFLEGKCYAMALFSQGSAYTQTDFRKYNGTGIQRKVPFMLPVALEEQLVTLFGMLGLNTGSADILAGTDGRFYFLEINPAGQFEMLAQPCNYNLTGAIARLLIHHDNTSSC